MPPDRPSPIKSPRDVSGTHDIPATAIARHQDRRAMKRGRRRGGFRPAQEESCEVSDTQHETARSEGKMSVFIQSRSGIGPDDADKYYLYKD